MQGKQASPPQEQEWIGLVGPEILVFSYGVFQKNFTIGISIISMALKMIEGYVISHLKGGIHSSVLSIKTFLCDTHEPRHKQIKIGYQIKKILDIGKSFYLEI